jgi:WD40 repeat protein
MSQRVSRKKNRAPEARRLWPWLAGGGAAVVLLIAVIVYTVIAATRKSDPPAKPGPVAAVPDAGERERPAPPPDPGPRQPEKDPMQAAEPMQMPEKPPEKPPEKSPDDRPTETRRFTVNTNSTMALSASGKGLRAIGGHDGTGFEVKQIAVATGEQIDRVRVLGLGRGISHTALAVSPDGEGLLLGLSDQTTRYLRQGKVEKVFEIPSAVLAFAPDGNAALCGNQGTLGWWDLDFGREWHCFDGLEGVTAVAYAPDGRHGLSGHQDGTVRLWDLPARTEVKSWKLAGMGPGRPQVQALAASPDIKRILAGTTLGLWLCEPDQEPRLLANTLTSCVQFSPDGKRALVGSSGYAGMPGDTLTLWDIETGKVLHALPGHNGVMAVAFNPDGRTAFSAGTDPGPRGSIHCVREWKLPGPAELIRGDPPAPKATVDPPGDFSGLIARLEGHENRINAVALSADGKLALSAGDLGTPHLYEIATQQMLRDLKDPKENPMSGKSKLQQVIFSPDGKKAYGVDEALAVKVWDTATGKELTQYKDPGLGRPFLCPDGRHILFCTAMTTRLCEVGTGREVRRIASKPAPGTPFGPDMVRAFSPDGKRALAGGGGGPANPGGVVHVWDLAAGRETQQFKGMPATGSLAFFPDGKRVLSQDDKGQLMIWDCLTGKELKRFDGPKEHVGSAAVLADGRAVLAVHDHSLYLWDLEAGQRLARYRGQLGTTSSLAVSRDGRRAVTGGDDGRMRLWSLPPAAKP